MTRDEYVNSIKSAFVTIGTNGLMAIVGAKFPPLVSGVVGKIVKYLIEKAIRIIVDLAEMQMFFIYIDMRTAAQSKDFTNAAIANRKIQESGTPEEKANAEAHLIATFREFAKLAH